MTRRIWEKLEQMRECAKWRGQSEVQKAVPSARVLELLSKAGTNVSG